SLVLRDVDLWQNLGAHSAGRVTITLVTLDDALAKALEPRAASPARRLHVLRELVKANVPVSVNVAPVIPGLTDSELPALLRAVADAGCTRVAWALLRLPYQVRTWSSTCSSGASTRRARRGWSRSSVSRAAASCTTPTWAAAAAAAGRSSSSCRRRST